MTEEIKTSDIKYGGIALCLPQIPVNFDKLNVIQLSDVPLLVIETFKKEELKNE